MKANELQIGDLIQNTNGNIGRVIGFQFDLASESNEVVMRYHSNSTCWSGTKILRPIPLTAEILEKNGFVKHDKIHPYYLDYYHERDGFTIFNSRTWHGHILEYVHELQRALRCCGLWDLANNFII